MLFKYCKENYYYITKNKQIMLLKKKTRSVKYKLEINYNNNNKYSQEARNILYFCKKNFFFSFFYSD